MKIPIKKVGGKKTLPFKENFWKGPVCKTA